jgi:hypothetical protein
MKYRASLLGSLAVVGLTAAVALAQNAPARPVGPPSGPGPGAAIPLRLAYRAIGAAEVRGAGGRYLDAARTHYRSALARFGRSDSAGAAREAGAAAALARAAVDERPLPTPRDLPAPPPLPTTPNAAPDGPRAGGPGGPGMRGGFAMRGRFDPEALARYATLENTPEANEFAKNALEANLAHERALFAGNREEGLRLRRIAADLSLAVRMLASADHPEAFPRPQRRRPMDGRFGGPPGAVGLVPPEVDDEVAQAPPESDAVRL